MKKSFILYIDTLAVLDMIDNEKAGELFRALRDYNLGKDVVISDDLKLLFHTFKVQFDRDKEKYEKTCEARRKAGSKGGKQKVANASKSKQKVANLADSDNDNDSDSDSDSDIIERTPAQIAEEFFTSIEENKQNDVIDGLIKKYGESKTTKELGKFYNYWTEPTKNGKSVRWKKEKTFEIGRRFGNWMSNNF